MFNILENKYKQNLMNIEEWNYLRNYYREDSFIKNSNNAISKIQALKNIFYGFSNWFRRYDYLFFSDSGSRKLINNRMYNIFLDNIIDNLGRKKSLLVELSSSSHYDNAYTENIVSRRFIDLLIIIQTKFIIMRDITFLENLNNSSIDYKTIVKRFNIQYKIYILWFKLINPKYIFLTCYYDKQYIVKAAHSLNIPVIEVQHGLIGENHSSYYGPKWLDKTYIPDYLLVFNSADKENLKKSNLFNYDNLYVVGNFYLEYLKDSFIEDNKLKSIIKQYSNSIGVSLQWTVEDEIINFVNRVAKKLDNILFILIPRNYEDKYNQLKLEKNIIFYPSLDCYNIIMHCNYHLTVYSTCAIEAPFLDITNILVNIDNNSAKYLPSLTNTFLVQNEQEFLDIFKHNKIQDKLNMNNNDNLYLEYKNNIDNFLNILKKGL